MSNLEVFYSWIPEVATPKTPPSLKEKLMWTGAVLLVFFILGYIRPWGVSPQAQQTLSFLNTVLASQIGSLITAGIGPIVLAAIILQLIVGSGMWDIDLSSPKGKAEFMGMQKFLAIILAFFEAYVFTKSYLVPVPGYEWLVVLQVAFGSIILMYLDEVVMKWGIGSGISLFIASGVSKRIFVRAFLPGDGEFWKLLNFLVSGNIAAAAYPLWLFVATILVFLIVVWFEGVQVEIPITWARAKGVGGRYPIKLLYLTNIPVILAAALFANIILLGQVSQGTILEPIFGHYDPQTHQWTSMGLAYFVTSPYSEQLIKNLVAAAMGTPYPNLGRALIHALMYTILLTLTSVFFGWLWLELSGMGPREIARQLVQSGFTVPGFRRDPRVVEKVLERYIPVVAILGSAIVGILAAFTDTFGALASGMGLLLTVDIVYRYYELLMREQLLNQYPQLGKVLG